ncbi:hypothetical protein HAX54_049043, partial [Datura stramonium]|nr:hypothetical protein [Datura stramonium]
MSYQHVHEGPYPPPGYGPPPPQPQGYPPPGMPAPPGFYDGGYPAPPPPLGPHSYQGYFNDQYPPPPPQHAYHGQGGGYYGDDNGCSSFLRGCLATLCCCCLLEECFGILSATGVIRKVTLQQFAGGGTMTYKDQFIIISLSGSFLLSENNGRRSRTGRLSVSLARQDGRVFGSVVAGMLTAATPVDVVSIVEKGVKPNSEAPSLTQPLNILNFGAPVTETSSPSPSASSHSADEKGVLSVESVVEFENLLAGQEVMAKKMVGLSVKNKEEEYHDMSLHLERYT